MNPVTRMLNGFALAAARGPRHGQQHVEASRRTPHSPSQRPWLTLMIATLVPAAVGLALILLRGQLAQGAAVVLVVPTITIAFFRGLLGAIVAALSASLAFNAFLTVPYWSFRIDDVVDIATMIVLLAVGTFAGLIGTAFRDLSVQSATREHHLSSVTRIVRSTSAEELEKTTCDGITTALNASSTRWQLGYHGSVDPLLTWDVAASRMGATLPTVEISVGPIGEELGRFVVRSRDAVTSQEERRAALAMAELFGRTVAARRSAE